MKTIYIDRPIGTEADELSARWLRSQLPATGENITLMIHCEGGSVLEGFAMMDIIAAYPGKISAVVSSMALSMGSMLLTECDEVMATENSYLMLHDAHMDDKEMNASEQKLIRSMSSRMVDLYARRMRKPASVVRQMMAAETFLNASEAVSCGLADKIVEASRLQISARAIPSRIVARIKAASPVGTSATARWKAAVNAKAATMPRAKAIMAVETSHPGLRLKMLAETNRK